MNASCVVAYEVLSSLFGDWVGFLYPLYRRRLIVCMLSMDLAVTTSVSLCPFFTVLGITSPLSLEYVYLFVNLVDMILHTGLKIVCAR